jgi:hypothetical protein
MWHIFASPATGGPPRRSRDAGTPVDVIPARALKANDVTLHPRPPTLKLVAEGVETPAQLERLRTRRPIVFLRDVPRRPCIAAEDSQ